MNKTAVYGLLIALVLPLTGYFIVKSLSVNAVIMPRHYIYDSVINKVEKGKQISDTLWHKIPDFTLTNQLGQKVGWNDIPGKVTVADFFLLTVPPFAHA